MSYEFYKLLHILGIAAVVLGLAGLIQSKISSPSVKPDKSHFIFHGIGLLVILISGFGMLAKLGILSNLPGWVVAKLFIWLLVGGSIVLAKRKPNLATVLRVTIVGLVGIAAYLALYKPF